MAAYEPVTKYYEALISSYDILTDAVARASDRGLKITKQFAADVARGQHDALELGHKLAAQPADLAQYCTAVLEATTAAQGRALAFTQTAYEEAIGAGGDAREVVEKLVEANRETAQAAVDVARKWATANPVAEILRNGIEPKPAAKKAAV